MAMRSEEALVADFAKAQNGQEYMTSERDRDLTRRDLLSVMAAGSAALITACARSVLAAAPPSPRTTPRAPVTAISSKDSMPTPTALSANHSIVALPFAAASLNGISERMIWSHHENNYGGAVKNLNRVEQELADITKDTPPFVVAALRERELLFRNSKTLHEAYFANLGGDGRRAGAIEAALSQAYGSSAHWEEHFRATGLGLGGGSGWVMLNFELDTGALRTCASGNHTQALATSMPLFVMDMYEHAYQMDFGASAAKYIDAFFNNAKWDEVNRRLERAQKAWNVLRGVVR
jgi:superoxide dismutase, Fe-Mn family